MENSNKTQTQQEQAFKLLQDLYLFDHSFEKHTEALHEMFIGFIKYNNEHDLLDGNIFDDIVFLYTEIRRLLQESEKIFKEES